MTEATNGLCRKGLSYLEAMKGNNSNRNESESRPAENNETLNNGLQKLTLIPPFTKAILSDTENFGKRYLECVEAIMETFTPDMRSQVTISRTYTKIRNRNLHSLLVVAPEECEAAFQQMCIEGVEMLNKTVFPYVERQVLSEVKSSNFSRKAPFPKFANVKLRNLPFVCPDYEVETLLGLPDGVHPTRKLFRQTERTNIGTFYNGNASLQVSIMNEQAEEQLRQWSYDLKVNGGTVDWMDIPISFHCPSLHFCEHCSETGHHIDWCFRFKKMRAKQTEVSANNEKSSYEKANEETSTSEAQHQSEETSAQIQEPDEELLIAEGSVTPNENELARNDDNSNPLSEIKETDNVEGESDQEINESQKTEPPDKETTSENNESTRKNSRTKRRKNNLRS